MSFILDALKKLEQKRQQSAVPTLMTAHAPDPVKPAKRSIWLYLILSALLLNVLLLTFWLHPWDSEKQEVTKEPAVTKQLREDAGIHHQGSTRFIKSGAPDLHLQKPEAGFKQSSHVSGKPAAKPVPEPEPNASLKGPAVNTVHKEAPYAVKETPDAGSKSSPEDPPALENNKEVTEKIQTASGESLSSLDILPLSIRQEIPEITISVHIYSDSPSERLVNINGSLRHEGDMLTSGIKLIEITDSGVILSYKDLSFFVKGF